MNNSDFSIANKWTEKIFEYVSRILVSQHHEVSVLQTYRYNRAIAQNDPKEKGIEDFVSEFYMICNAIIIWKVSKCPVMELDKTPDIIQMSCHGIW